MVRPGRLQDVPRLHAIEHAAGEAFRDVGMQEVADDPDPTEDALADYVRRDAALALELDGVIAAYLLFDLVDGAMHVEQVSVHPDFAGNRHGQALLDHAAEEARRLGLSGLTLTTFVDVPWNRPYYERLGFTRIPDAKLGPQLRAVREHEAAIGLDRWPRCAMRRDLG